jgi:hypothetical protein
MKTKKKKHENEISEPESKANDLTIEQQVDKFAEIIIKHIVKRLHENKTLDEIT